MNPRTGPYEAYWYLAAERQNMFYRRFHGAGLPLTDDPILQRYKFCNAYRAADRVSQFLIRRVIYAGERSAEDALFRILLFRLLNRCQTWERLESQVGSIALATFDAGAYAAALEAQREDGPIYGNAFILCATKAFGFDEKHRNHLALLEWIFRRSDFALELLAAPSLEALFTALKRLPLIGPFMAYQLAIDLNYSDLFSFDENDFTCAGPGALRGIAKCFADTGGRRPAEIISWMVANQEREFDRLGLEFLPLGRRRLHAIDCQNLFCETDKYCRVRFPELASNRVRIKAAYAPSGPPISYFFPPKWGIGPGR